jgi:hypothetical protein
MIMEKSSWNEVKTARKNKIAETSPITRPVAKPEVMKPSKEPSVFKMVLANQHYWQYGWELVSQRSEEDHIRNDCSTFTSVVQAGSNKCSSWRF